MYKIVDWFDIILSKLMIFRIRKSYYARCWKENYVEDCVSCEAGKIVKWLENHIALIKSK